MTKHFDDDEQSLHHGLALLYKEMVDYFYDCHIRLDEMERRAGFNPAQPRHPDSTGGEWSDGGGSGETRPEPSLEKPKKPSVIGELFGIRPAHADELPRSTRKLNTRTTVQHASITLQTL